MGMPNEYALASICDPTLEIMDTFDGKDEQTRAQIGYATIIRKINSSDSNTSWVYLLKNLMILDCALERKLFVEELSEQELPVIAQFKYSAQLLQRPEQQIRAVLLRWPAAQILRTY